MYPFQYTKAKEASEATATASRQENSKFLAGGTNLVDLIRRDVVHPDYLIDVSHLDFKTIKAYNGGLRLGAMASNSETAANKELKEAYPIVSQAILLGASAQLRNKASNGGNMLQKTRCPYFMSPPFPCNKREPGSGCSAINGENRLLSILGTSEKCIASYPSDMATALTAMDAVIQTRLSDGSERSIPVVDFHLLPEDTPWKETVLKEGELITAIDLPEESKEFAENSYYLKIRDRHSFAFALVSVAAALVMESGKITKARLVLGSVAPKPWRNREAEEMLLGQAPSENLFMEVAEKALEGAKGFGENDFKIPLAKKGIVRALRIASKSEA
ncbi:xanthine dehydrogenase family protein subunit M [Zunongwangia sp. F363]|uniref:Xanthine dehydrogenase family protein subunit M n=1 Tax=Autumnicola tepida TaxID=3075595 RepID=A0ABU3C8Q7_9FLAO|nr:xanthine dehydrogenase family protein subunit M [Zunongwangia sp. F363]MDT0642676.1 xanthine dehydrogenase family protein subunit M [Zunongwangia sp. F363]